MFEYFDESYHGMAGKIENLLLPGRCHPRSSGSHTAEMGVLLSQTADQLGAVHVAAGFACHQHDFRGRYGGITHNEGFIRLIEASEPVGQSGS